MVRRVLNTEPDQSSFARLPREEGVQNLWHAGSQVTAAFLEPADRHLPA
jgi:hypothetical protein